MPLLPTAAEEAVHADRAALAKLKTSAAKIIGRINARLSKGIEQPGKAQVSAADYSAAWGANLTAYQSLAETLAPMVVAPVTVPVAPAPAPHS